MAGVQDEDFRGHGQTGQRSYTDQNVRNDSVPGGRKTRMYVNQGRRKKAANESGDPGENATRKNRFPRKKHLEQDGDMDSSSQDESYRRRSNYNRRRPQWNQAYRGFQGERSSQSRQGQNQVEGHPRQKQQGPREFEGQQRGQERGPKRGQRENQQRPNEEQGQRESQGQSRRRKLPGQREVRGQQGQTQGQAEDGFDDGSNYSDGNIGSVNGWDGSETEATQPRRRNYQNTQYDLNYHYDSGSDSGYGRSRRRYGNRPPQRSHNGSDYGGYSPNPYSQGNYSPTPYYSGESPVPFHYQGYYPHMYYQGSPTPYQNLPSPSMQLGRYSPATTNSDSNVDGLPPKGNPRSHAERYGKRNTDSPKKQKKPQLGVKRRSSASPSRRSPVVSSDENQMGVLIEQLSNGTYECPVCYDHVRCEAYVWNCKNCYTVFHLKCIRKWALSQAAAVEGSDGWMCPACRHETTQIPFAYKCFCGKSRDPQYVPGEIPHSCGEVCRGRRPGDHCNHPCTILCHPGPCPPCPANVESSCHCGRTKKTVRCSTVKEFQCDEVCGEILLCGQHYCEEVCHKDNCKPCGMLLQKACFCGKKTVSFTCGSEEDSIWGLDGGFSCDVPCQKQLSCGYHSCTKTCHAGDCGPCLLTPEAVTHCPCGKTPLADLKGNDRDKCIDPIPTCQEICGKALGCGGEDNPHHCERTCHEGSCPPCNKTTLTKCACGHRYVDASCIDLINSDKGYKKPTCDRKCTKRRHCGKHKCNKKCCTDLNHICDQICGRKLNCGVHFCEEFCHVGDCTRCLEASFEELTCHCGAQIVEPPIPCGTRPPPCDYPCARRHECNHPVRHTCHNDDQCPPCVELTSKYCFGKHELRHNLPCHIKEISCGKPCNKPLACGAHSCTKICHKGECEDGGKCSLPCTLPRSTCGHACNAPCHIGLSCPMVWTACRAKVEVKCACGNLTETAMCMSGASEASHQRSSAAIASKMHSSADGVDISDMVSGKRKVLECNEMCSVIERNRRLAEALQIKDAELRPDVGAPPYSDFMKDMARKNPASISSVEKGLGNLVHSVQDSKFQSRSHQFPCMNRDLRRLIHELAEFYGCQTQSYDQDPNRNVVATARKDKCYIPNMTLSAVVQRERFPKVPMPIPHHRNMDIRSPSPSTKLYSDSENSVMEKSKKIQPKEAEDFFDWTG